MRLTLTTLRGGTVWDEAPPEEAAEAIARQIPEGRPLAIYQGEEASRVAGALARELMARPPSPKLIVLVNHLQVIERREQSRIVILR
jgi:hypothetical protein